MQECVRTLTHDDAAPTRARGLNGAFAADALDRSRSRSWIGARHFGQVILRSVSIRHDQSSDARSAHAISLHSVLELRASSIRLRFAAPKQPSEGQAGRPGVAEPRTMQCRCTYVDTAPGKACGSMV